MFSIPNTKQTNFSVLGCTILRGITILTVCSYNVERKNIRIIIMISIILTMYLPAMDDMYVLKILWIVIYGGAA